MTKKNEETNKATPNSVALSWRLGKLPSVEEVQALVKDSLITKDEARSILFKELDQEEKIKTLEEQVAFQQDVIKMLIERQPVNTITKYIYDYTPRYSGPYWISTASNSGTTYKVFANNVATSMSLPAGGTSTTTLTSGGGAINL